MTDGRQKLAHAWIYYITLSFEAFGSRRKQEQPYGVSDVEAGKMICKYSEWYENRNDSNLSTNILLRKFRTFTSELVMNAKKTISIFILMVFLIKKKN